MFLRSKIKNENISQDVEFTGYRLLEDESDEKQSDSKKISNEHTNSTEEKKIQGLVDSSLFKQKDLTTSERCIQSWVSLGIDRCNSDLLTKQYQTEDALIGYRGTTMRPENVFQNGFSAYSLKRSPYSKMFFCTEMSPQTRRAIEECQQSPDDAICKVICAILCNYIICAPLKCGIACTAACCKDPTCGLKMYDTPYASNWTALALSSEIQHAISFLGEAEVPQWRYAVYLNGAVLFDKFSNNKSPSKEPNGRQAYDAKEIFPKDLKNQTISATRIIAAVQTESLDAYGDYSYAYKENFSVNKRFYFNREFAGWHLIEPALRGHPGFIDRGPHSSFIVVMKASELEILLKKYLIEPAPQRQMMI